ncbi:hypothetical protein KPL70_014707 [Citrus sinensis]|nr:hypothetical protein KPL70_014707 [Citrus sinensis]
MAEASSSSSSARITVTNAKFEVEKFDSTNNFGMWQCEVLDVLCQQELDVALEEKPDVMDDNEWIKINRQACGIIHLCLAKDKKYSVMRETSTKKLWETLEEKYIKKSLENRLYMKKKLYRFTYTHDMSMNDHVNSFNKILADLLNLDERFEDEDATLLVLNSLPDEYHHLTTTLLHGKNNVMFDAVYNALYNSETRKKDIKDHRDTIAKALTARGRSQSRKPGKRNKSKGRLAKDECAFCREKGLWKKNCPKLQKGKATFDACVVEHDDESNFSLVGLTFICHSDEWILDSGCTYHMCLNKGWFSSFKELDGGVVSMGNNNACKTMGIDQYQQFLKKMQIQKQPSCGIYVWDMLTRVKFGLVIHDIKRIMDYVHSDMWGPTKTVSLGDEGIVRHFTVRDTPQHNGVAERMNQTILEKVQCMLSNAGLGKEFWAEAVVYACHLINRLPSTAIEGRTPMEMWIDSQEDDKTNSTLQQVEFEKVKAGLAGVDEMDNDSPSIENDEEVLTQEPSQQQDLIAYKRPHREIHKPAHFVDMVAYAFPIVDDDVPSTYREAEKKAIGCKWVYAKNEGFPRKNEIRYKARLVAKGYAQKEGVDNNETKPVSTLLAYHFKLSAQLSPSTDAERKYMLQVPYSNAVGNLMYAMVCTRLDISHAVGIVSRYMHNLGKGQWQTVKWILRYIQKTLDVGLLFERDDTLGQGVIGYVDSDYAGGLDKRRSTTEYVFTFAGGPISWKSTLQSIIALSTTEAEYMAITEAVKEAIWLQGLLENLGLAQEHINVYCDSQSAIHLTKNQVYHARTKHIDVQFHFVREIVDDGNILLQKIKTGDNPTDMLTKVVTTIKFEHFQNLINILQV